MSYQITVTEVTPQVTVTTNSSPVAVQVEDQSFNISSSEYTVTVTNTTTALNFYGDAVELRLADLNEFFQGEWSATTAYQRGDIVTHKYSLFLLKQFSVDVFATYTNTVEPEFDTDYWQRIVWHEAPFDHLTVTNATRLLGPLQADGTALFNNTVEFDNTVEFNNTVTMNRELLVTGTIEGATNLNVSGDTRLNALTVTNRATVGSLSIGGSADADGLYVNGLATFMGTATFNGATYFNNSLDVNTATIVNLYVDGLKYPTNKGVLGQILKTNGVDKADWVDISSLLIWNLTTDLKTNGYNIGTGYDPLVENPQLSIFSGNSANSRSKITFDQGGQTLKLSAYSYNPVLSAGAQDTTASSILLGPNKIDIVSFNQRPNSTATNYIGGTISLDNDSRSIDIFNTSDTVSVYGAVSKFTGNLRSYGAAPEINMFIKSPLGNKSGTINLSALSIKQSAGSAFFDSGYSKFTSSSTFTVEVTATSVAESIGLIFRSNNASNSSLYLGRRPDAISSDLSYYSDASIKAKYGVVVEAEDGGIVFDHIAKDSKRLDAISRVSIANNLITIKNTSTGTNTLPTPYINGINLEVDPTYGAIRLIGPAIVTSLKFPDGTVQTSAATPGTGDGYVGSRGDTGFTGSRGVQGNQGGTGFTGSAGTNGAIGYTGSFGYVGSQGIPGEYAAIGFTGSMGYSGSVGTGFQWKGTYQRSSVYYRGDVVSFGESLYILDFAEFGPSAFDPPLLAAVWDPFVRNGYQGSTGFTGSAGTNGIDGAAAAIGYTGSKGDQGSTGYVGSQGLFNNTLTSDLSTMGYSLRYDTDVNSEQFITINTSSVEISTQNVIIGLNNDNSRVQVNRVTNYSGVGPPLFVHGIQFDDQTVQITAYFPDSGLLPNLGP